MGCNYYRGKCLFLNGKDDDCKGCPIKKAYSQGYKQATCDATASKEKENRDCSTCARYSEFQKEIPEECEGCKHNYFSNYKEKGGAE